MSQQSQFRPQGGQGQGQVGPPQALGQGGESLAASGQFFFLGGQAVPLPFQPGQGFQPGPGGRSGGQFPLQALQPAGQVRPLSAKPGLILIGGRGGQDGPGLFQIFQPAALFGPALVDADGDVAVESRAGDLLQEGGLVVGRRGQKGGEGALGQERSPGELLEGEAGQGGHPGRRAAELALQKPAAGFGDFVLGILKSPPGL